MRSALPVFGVITKEDKDNRKKTPDISHKHTYKNSQQNNKSNPKYIKSYIPQPSMIYTSCVQFSSVQSLSRVRLFATP